MHRKTHFLLFCLFWLSLGAIALPAKAAIQIPKNLTQTDRAEALRILGFGTSSKILSDPYPLGGYLGFEVGVSVENVPAEDIGRLGAGLATPQADVSVPKITLGKGLFNNIDAFLQFTPYNRTDEVAQAGGLIRWGFYQGTTFPLNLSALVHANTANIGNLLTARSYGADLIAGVNVESVALFAGIGYVEASGTFLGGAAAITDTLKVENETVSGTHTVVGATIQFSSIFFALQLDRYTLPVFSGKLGVRF